MYRGNRLGDAYVTEEAGEAKRGRVAMIFWWVGHGGRRGRRRQAPADREPLPHQTSCARRGCRPAWPELPVVRDGNVWAVDATSYFSRPRPRVVDGAEEEHRPAPQDRQRVIN